MGNFFAELKRRHIYRVAAAYAVVAWVLLQVVNNVAPVLELPAWVSRASLLFLALGFPVAIFFAWMRELPDATAFAQHKTTLADWAFVGVLATIVGLVSYEQLTPTTATATATANGVETARKAAASPVGAISLAVLPFENLSADKDQEFFSAGMTEEITSALAKIPDLRVVARASAFELKNESGDMKTIAEMLHATHLIKGSVRKAGTRLRITAQLINAENSVSIWTDNYDRDLTDVFAIQEDIARAIATSLRMPLGLKPGDNLVNNRSIDPESYQEYLRASAMVRARGLSSLTQATAMLERIVERHSDFSPAWSQLALAYALLPNFGGARGSLDEQRRFVTEFFPKAEAAAQRAIQLDPGGAGGYVALARAELGRKKYVVAEDMFKKALALDPNSSDALSIYANMLADVGRLKDALALKQQLQALESFVPIYNGTTAMILWLNGENDAAIAMLKALRLNFPGRNSGLASIYASMGRYAEAADALAESSSGVVRSSEEREAARLLGSAPAVAAAPEKLPHLGNLSFVFLYVGAPERALEPAETDVQAGNGTAFTYNLWHPVYGPVRKTERFKALIRAKGLIDYWKARGWPDLCHPATGDDFECN